MRYLARVLASKGVKWVAPKWEDEANEFLRYEDIYPLEKWEEMFEKAKGKLIPLSEEDWQRLDNSDSYAVKSIGDARRLAKKYKKDINSIEKAFAEGRTLPAPVFIAMREGELQLAGGNTRLMVARALDVTPKVVIIESGY